MAAEVYRTEKRRAFGPGSSSVGLESKVDEGSDKR